MIGWLILATYLAGVVFVLYPAFRWIQDCMSYGDDEGFELGVYGVLATLVSALWPLIAVGGGAFLLSRHMWRYRFAEDMEKVPVEH